MNIVDSRKNREVTFDELKCGDVFRCENILYVKTKEITIQGGSYINSIRLPECDTYFWFQYNRIVEEVKHSLILD